jgi:chloride channel protein, CIC family
VTEGCTVGSSDQDDTDYDNGRTAASLLRILSVALLAGCITGLVGSAFHAGLDGAQRLRDAGAIWAHHLPALGLPALSASVVLAAIVARGLVIRFAPVAAGSGIQHVEAVVRGRAAPAGLAAIPVKFVGGILAIGAGLALGREGPTVQMGATIGSLCGGRLLRSTQDQVAIHAASAGAGLAVAFNAPIGGCIFVFEELTKRITQPLLWTTLVATGAAIATMRVLYGNVLDLVVPSTGPVALPLLPAYLALGVLLGFAGCAYNAITLALLHAADRLRAVPWPVTTGGIGLLIGLLVWFAPGLAGGGENLTRSVLVGRLGLTTLEVVLALRFLIGPISYAAGTPGGLFMPLLMVGAACGATFAELLTKTFSTAVSPVDCAIIGMAGLFSAIVRAPLTGIALVIEMTGRADLSLSILAASITAAIIAAWLGSPPIYDSLGRRMLADPSRAPHVLKPARTT